jgi:hypothetical protein
MVHERGEEHVHAAPFYYHAVFFTVTTWRSPASNFSRMFGLVCVTFQYCTNSKLDGATTFSIGGVVTRK